MKTWTVHTASGKAPVLVMEAFSWGAFLFGPVWLLACGAWITGLITGLITLAVCAAVQALVPVASDYEWAVMCLPVVFGVFGRDLRRLDLLLHGYCLAHVVAANGDDDAMLRLLNRHPDLGAALV